MRRGAVVKTARHPNCDPLNMKRVAGGEELAPQALVADVPELPEAVNMRRMTIKNIEFEMYAQGARQMFWYKTGDEAWSS